MDTYYVPREMLEVWNQYNSLVKLRDEILKNGWIPFAYRRAKKAGFEAEKKRNEFWGMFYEIYPEATKYAAYVFNYAAREIKPKENK